MELVSEYIHCNIFRKMCETQPNSNQTNPEYKKPDIEMGYKQISIISKPPLKTILLEQKRIDIDILNYKV